MEIFGLPEWLKTDGTLESSGTLESGQHHEFTLTGTPVASQDAHSVVFVATMMITGDTPEIEDGKITINVDDSGGSIAEIIADMTDEEKQSITKLEINSEVQSLEWISELKNLEQLTLNNNASVEELDVSDNTSITELKTHGANVKTLNASSCGNLVSLDCSSCGLESINLNGCISLNILNIRDNGLLMFDAGNLASLQELICDSQVV